MTCRDDDLCIHHFLNQQWFQANQNNIWKNPSFKLLFWFWEMLAKTIFALWFIPMKSSILNFFLSVCEEVPVLWSKITDWFFTWMVLEQTLQRHRLFLSAKQTWLFQCGSNWYRPFLRTQYKLYTVIGPFHGSSGSLWWTVVVLIFKPGETLTESTMYLLLELPNTIGKSNKSVGGSGNGEGGGWGQRCYMKQERINLKMPFPTTPTANICTTLILWPQLGVFFQIGQWTIIACVRQQI